MKSRVIFLENGTSLCARLAEWLRGAGFEVDLTGSVFDFYREMAVNIYDIAVIGGELPGNGALEVVSWMSGKDDVGIVLLTERGDTDGRIEGYQKGADLCFAKPVDGDELTAAIHSLVRRIGRAEVPAGEAAEPSAQWTFDPAQWLLQAPNGNAVRLNSSEMRVIQRLVESAGTAVAREELRIELGHGHGGSGNQKLDALISRLRSKIRRRTASPAPVQTLHGRGYLFSAPVRVTGTLQPVKHVG
jgi:DNA-binding response OmpR family regulator